MKEIARVYTEIVRRHLRDDRQMVFLSGPRQVGKTTLCEGFQDVYLNWDKSEQRAVILKGESAVMDFAGGDRPRAKMPVVTFDELHHYKKWKCFLKGFFDLYWKQVRVLVTGSARLDVYKKGGDSLMGRYFSYRMHPLSVGELLRPNVKEDEICPVAQELDEGLWQKLLVHGGFPEPFSKGDRLFLRKWRRLRFEQLVREDIRKDTSIRELDQLESMALILAERSGEQLVYASLGAEIQVSEITVRNWVSVLNSFFFGFLVKPWSAHVENSIRKTPKWYLRDWSGIADPGKRNETLVACHLLKAVEYWTDLGFGDYDLHYVRDKQKNEVDFLVSKDKRPWFLVEVKTGDVKLSPALKRFQERLGARHAFQVVFDIPYEQVDCFSHTEPVVVPVKTFLSQLV
jgi:uncharacterized protein